jgi:hypothetical protein
VHKIRQPLVGIIPLVIVEFPEIVGAFGLAGESVYLLRVVVHSVEVDDQVHKRLITKREFAISARQSRWRR